MSEICSYCDREINGKYYGCSCVTQRSQLQEALMGDDKIEDLEFIVDDLSFLDVKFDSGFGCCEGYKFYAWSKDWVYYCEEYDGSESVSFVPRNPVKKELEQCGMLVKGEDKKQPLRPFDFKVKTNE